MLSLQTALVCCCKTPLPTIVQTLLGHLMGTTGKTLEKSPCLQFVQTLVALEKSSFKV
jgi:hypothetical protein